MPSDTLTLLRCRSGHRATKRWTEAGCESFDCGFRFDVASADVSGVIELGALLESLRARPDLFIVRAAGEQARGVRRRAGRPDDHFRDVGRYWAMLDIDSAELPGDFAADPENGAALARETLPEPFRKAACYWHASASAGFKPGVRVHLWFWLDRPLVSAEWRSWLRSWGNRAVDWQVFKSVQPHYTADPLIEGVPDPLSLRSGMLPGEPEVCIGDTLGVNSGARATADKLFETALLACRRAPDGERNNILYRHACRVARYAPLLRETWREELISACTIAAIEASATIESAVRSTEVAAVCEPNAWARNLQMLANGTWAPTAANMIDVADLHPALEGALALNERTRAPIWLRLPPWGRGAPGRDLVDADGPAFAHWLDRMCRFAGSAPRAALEALLSVAPLQPVDPFRDWLEGLEWDGIPRLDTWLIDACSTEDSTITRAFGRRWLISAVARTLSPGCKADCMLLLIGAQGAGKSTLFRDLAGPAYFSELQARLGDDDAYMQLQGPVIVELAELAAMTRRDIEVVKQDLSTAVDRRRAKYGRLPETIPRRCVYAGTTNVDAPLQDATGGRRFWPVPVAAIKPDWIVEHRDQLWAEAVAYYLAGEPWWLSPEEAELAEPVQEAYRESDALEEQIADWLRARHPQGTLTAGARLDAQRRIISCRAMDVLDGLDGRALDRGACIQVARVLRALGWRQRHTASGRWYHAPKGWHT